MHSEAAALGAYNVGSDVSVSGFSSGGFMAVQMAVAYSATIKAGTGVEAGGPYYCDQGNFAKNNAVCTNAANPYSLPPTATLESTTDSWASSGYIDPTSNLTNTKVYLFSGTLDTTVNSYVVGETNNYFKHYVTNANVHYNNTIASQHGFSTDYSGNACATSYTPFINNCSFDLAGTFLQWIYGTLHAKSTGKLGGSIVPFDQSAFISSPQSKGMDTTGYLYVPANCAAQQRCKLHVVFHGCSQSAHSIGSQYYTNTGYNKWADTNNIIVLYPQAYPITATNPYGCWDYWGYTGANYAKKSGVQLAAIKAMIIKIQSGYQ
jgi:poly(3-hydroxybutyrate) depolymerase